MFLAERLWSSNSLLSLDGWCNVRHDVTQFFAISRHPCTLIQWVARSRFGRFIAWLLPCMTKRSKASSLRLTNRLTTYSFATSRYYSLYCTVETYIYSIFVAKSTHNRPTVWQVLLEWEGYVHSLVDYELATSQVWIRWCHIPTLWELFYKSFRHVKNLNSYMTVNMYSRCFSQFNGYDN